MITEVLRYGIPVGEAAAFEAAYAEAGKILRDSVHCLGFELLHGTEEPVNWVLTIRWTSSEGHLQGFRKSPKFPEFFRLVKPFFAQIQEMKHYESTTVNWSGPSR